MPYDVPTANLRHSRFLPRRSTLVLDGARGTTIAVDRGSLWVTLEHDLRDVILVAGMRFEIDRDGRTVAAAEEDSRVRLLRKPTVLERFGARLGRAASPLLRSWSRRLRSSTVPYY